MKVEYQFVNLVEHKHRITGFISTQRLKAVKRIEGAADFELEKDGRVSLLSARRWKAAVTGIEPLRELAAAGERRGAAECLIAVAGDMSEKARAFLKDKGLTALEGSELVMRTRRKR